MALGLIGRKVGMTRIFNEDGDTQPVTVIEVTPNRVTQVRTEEVDGYNGVQVTTGSRRPNRVSAAMKGHFAKAEVEPGRGVWEFRLSEAAEQQAGDEVKVDLFEQGAFVDVQGTSKGKGFQGGIKRHNFSSQRMTHGNSLSHRAPGSIGQNQTPGRVFKGKKMAGHMGAATVTQQGLEIVRVDSERELLLVRGSVPGAKGGDVVVTPSIKNKKPKQA